MPSNQSLYSKSWFALNSGTRAQNTVHHLLSIRNPRVVSAKENTVSLIMQDLSVALQGTDPSIIYIFINALGSVNTIFSPIPEDTALYSSTACTFDTSVYGPVSVFTVGINGNSQFDLIPFNFKINPGDVITIAVSSTNSISNSGVGLVWQRE